MQEQHWEALGGTRFAEADVVEPPITLGEESSFFVGSDLETVFSPGNLLVAFSFKSGVNLRLPESLFSEAPDGSGWPDGVTWLSLKERLGEEETFVDTGVKTLAP